MYIDILCEMKNTNIISEIAVNTNHSIQIVKNEIKFLFNNGLIDAKNIITDKGYRILDATEIQNAIFVNFDSQYKMLPYSDLRPTPLLEIFGTPLIEHNIEQLKELGIEDISILVGDRKEHYKYLESDFGVKIIYDKNWETSTGFEKLKLIKDELKHTLIIDSSTYINVNSSIETHFLSSIFYITNNTLNKVSRSVVLDTDKVKGYIPEGEKQNTFLGMSLINKQTSELLSNITDYNDNTDFWKIILETSLNDKMNIKAKKLNINDLKCIRKATQLSNFDNKYNEFDFD